MSGNILSPEERQQLTLIPLEISEADLVWFFTLHSDDLDCIDFRTKPSHRLDQAAHLCWLRWLGWSPVRVDRLSAKALVALCQQSSLAHHPFLGEGTASSSDGQLFGVPVRTVHTRLTQTWPEIVNLAKKKGAMILFGDEASFAQWGSLSYTWARKGQQPTVKTSGKRKAYKIFGLIDYLSGAFFYQAQTGRFTSESYSAFLQEVLAKTHQHLIIIQDGARYHTSQAMQQFFAHHTDRLTVYQLPAYSPEFNPIEYLWRNIKKQATHLCYFPAFADLMNKVDQKLRYFANAPKRILNLMGKYCQSLGAEVA